MPVVTELLHRADRAEAFNHFARLRAMEALSGVVQDSSPFLLVLDDAQWADPETIATLGYLARRCTTAPVAVLLTCQHGRSSELLRRLPVDVRIDLEELSAPDLAALGPGLYEATNGHPLFVTDWLAAAELHLSDGFTPALRERVITRCWGFGPQSYRLLTVASLLDQPFCPSLLARLVDASDDSLEQLTGSSRRVCSSTQARPSAFATRSSGGSSPRASLPPVARNCSRGHRAFKSILRRGAAPTPASGGLAPQFMTTRGRNAHHGSTRLGASKTRAT